MWSKARTVYITRHAHERWEGRGGVGPVLDALIASDHYAQMGNSEYRITPGGMVAVIHEDSCLTFLTIEQAVGNLQHYTHNKRGKQQW